MHAIGLASLNYRVRPYHKENNTRVSQKKNPGLLPSPASASLWYPHSPSRVVCPWMQRLLCVSMAPLVKCTSRMDGQRTQSGAFSLPAL